MNATPPNRQIESLTSLRGLLALWVVAFHFGNDAALLLPAFGELLPITRVGYLAVPGFFVLSGFVLAFNYAERFSTWPPRGVLKFWALRLARIYPVHLVTLLAVLAMVAVAWELGYQLTDAGYTTRDFVLNLLLMQTWVPDFRLSWNYPSWSISSEWFAYLVFPFAAAGLLRRIHTPSQAAILAVGCFAATSAILAVGPFPFRELLLVVPTFFAGMAFCLLAKQTATASNRVPRSLPELLLLLLAASCFLPMFAGTLLILLALFALVLFLARLGTRSHSWWMSPPLLFLGEVSYSLYMTHTLAQKVLSRLLPASRFEDADSFIRVGVAATYVVAIAASCLVSYYLVERPCRRWLRRRLTEEARASQNL